MTSELWQDSATIAEKLKTFPRPRLVEPLVFTLDSIVYPGATYLDENDERWLYLVVTTSQVPEFIQTSLEIIRKSIFGRTKHMVQYRFLDQNDQIWFVASYMLRWPIEEQYREFHPFGPTVLFKEISPEMAHAIELVDREKKLLITHWRKP